MPIQTAIDSISNSQGSPFGFKNRIINGAMVIDQRNVGASITPTNGQFSVDRWKMNLSQASKYTAQQNAGSVTPPAGFVNYLGITSSSAYSVLAADSFYLYQAIEGYNIADLGFGTTNAQTVTVSFWVRSSLTGSFGGSLAGYNGTTFRSYPFPYTINSANTWEYKTITIPGDTTTFAYDKTNSFGLFVTFSLGVGTTSSGTANAWTGSLMLQPTGSTSVVATNGATWYVTGVQLEKGTQATAFDYRDYGNELRMCQRYYESTAFPNVTFNIYQLRAGVCFVGALSISSGFNFLVPKRTDAPTVTLYSRNGTSGKVSLVTTGADVAGTSTANGIGGTGFVRVDLGAAQTGGAGIETGWTASAEL